MRRSIPFLVLFAACTAPADRSEEPTPAHEVAEDATERPHADLPVVEGVEVPEEPTEDPAPTDVPERAPWEADDVRTAVSRGGTYTVHWKPVGGPVPKNEHFELDVWVFRNRDDGEPEPVKGAIVVVDAWMPDHGHGMIRRPRSSDNGDGSYRVRGMLFHMGGHWDVFVDLIVDNISERAEYTLDL